MEPAADVNLGMGFPAIMPCAWGIGGLEVPLQHGELRTAALDDKPVNRIAAHRSANFAPKLLEKCHSLITLTAQCIPGGKRFLETPGLVAGEKGPN